jgi:hypothetical protein
VRLGACVLKIKKSPAPTGKINRKPHDIEGNRPGQSGRGERIFDSCFENSGGSFAAGDDEAMKWLHDEHVLDYVQIGPPGAAR